MAADGQAERRQLLAVEGDAVGRAARDAVVGRPRLQLAHRGLAVAAGGHLGEELASVTGLRIWLPESPPSSASMKAAEGRHPGGGVTTTPRGALRNGFSKCTNESSASSCSAPRTGLAWSAVKRVLRAESAATAATVEPCPRSKREGLGEGLVARPARREVGVADDGLGRPGQLQARGQTGGVALRERGGGVHPGAAVGLEPGAAQHLIAPVHLRADFVADAGLGERGDVDRHVGLVEHLVAAERGELVERARRRRARATPRPRSTASGLTASVVATSRWSVSASAMVVTPPVVTGTTTPTRRGPPVRRTWRSAAGRSGTW